MLEQRFRLVLKGESKFNGETMPIGTTLGEVRPFSWVKIEELQEAVNNAAVDFVMEEVKTETEEKHDAQDEDGG
jgi:hypothetical protein